MVLYQYIGAVESPISFKVLEVILSRAWVKGTPISDGFKLLK